MGVANNGAMIEFLSSKLGKSWAIILTMPNGMTCMIAAGENWEALPELADFRPFGLTRPLDGKSRKT